MATQRAKFVEGCKNTNQIDAKLAGHIFDNIEKFAGYGFNKSHSAAYGIISYRTAYLKAHYPVEFMAALLSLEIGNADKIPIFIAESKEMGLEVLPPNVNESVVRFKPEGKAIRFGLAGIKNVGSNAVQALVAEREANGPFTGLIDFCSRLDAHIINRKVLESLVKCGAFDYTHMSRGRLFNGIEFAMSRAASAQRDRISGQTTLFDMLDTDAEKDHADELPKAEPWPTHEMLSAEKELLGFYISGHPLKEHEWALNHFTLSRIANLSDEVPAGGATRVGGLVSQFARRITKRTQRPMGVFRLEGLEGAVDVVAFPDTFEQYGSLLRDEQPVMVCGERDAGDELKIKAQEIYPLEQSHRLFAHRIFLRVSSNCVEDKRLDKIREILPAFTGTTPVIICLQFPGGEKVFVDTGKSFEVEAGQQLVHALQRELGEESIYIEPLQRACLKEQKRSGRGSARRDRTPAAARGASHF
jgi:DNA polymerase-3 subunit alpha